MAAEVFLGLDILSCGGILLDVSSRSPGIDELHEVPFLALCAIYGLQVLTRESVSEEVKHVLRSVDDRPFLLGEELSHLLSEEVQLQPHVILHRPSAEFSYRLVPMIALSDIEELGLIVGNAATAV